MSRTYSRIHLRRGIKSMPRLLPLVSFLLFVLTLPQPVVSQCSATLQDDNIKAAINMWTNSQTRSQAEAQYGGHIRNWNVTCIRNLRSAFEFTTNFAEDLTLWDVSRVREMNLLFQASSGFRGNLSTWNTEQVVGMNRIFSRSISFDADATGVSNWKTGNVRDLRYGFASSLDFSGDLSQWNMSSVTDLDHLLHATGGFRGNLSGWNLQSATTASHLVSSSSIFSGYMSHWKLPSLDSLSYAFSDTTEYLPGDIPLQWSTPSLRSMNFILKGAIDFNTDILASFETPNLQEMASAFSGSVNLHGTLPAQWDTSGVEDFESLFSSAVNVTTPLMTSFDTSSVTSMTRVFRFCRDFRGDVSSWATGNVIYMDETFYAASNFPGWQISEWDTRSVRYIDSVFVDAVNFTFGSPDTLESTQQTVCWDLDNANSNSLAQATCASDVTFDCDCMSFDVYQNINRGCSENEDACVGDRPRPGGGSNDDEDESANTTSTESTEENLNDDEVEASSLARTIVWDVYALTTFLVFLLVLKG